MSSCGKGKSPIFLNPLRDVNLTSLNTGGAPGRRYVLTSTNMYGLGLGLTSLLVGVRVSGHSNANAKISVEMESSFDGVNWQANPVALITNYTALSEISAQTTTLAAFLPFVRVVLIVSDAGAQEWATLSAWVLYRYDS